MELKDLKPNPENPRRITAEKLEMLKKSIEQFGDLSGIVYNERTQRLVGGHQRVKVLTPEAKIVEEMRYSTPTDTGTVMVGHVVIAGDRFRYRAVSWDEATEKAANIAANQHGGSWDLSLLTEWVNELDSMNVDMGLVGFTNAELENLMAPEIPTGTAENQQRLDELKNVVMQCPHCERTFSKSEAKIVG